MAENLKKFKIPSGMKDILSAEAYLWQEAEDKAKAAFNLYGYKPIRTPLLEEEGLFNRSLGNETEIVKKQMFVIRHSEDSYVLRPEATAGVVRAYIENNLDKTDSFVKLYYIGPMFRAERPQKGRLRQFHHIGAEALGSNSPYLDSEIISLIKYILNALGISGYELKLNSLGCPEDKQKLSRMLQDRLKDETEKLCPDCKERLNRNVFRVLDCKNENCKQVVSRLSLTPEDYLCQECSEHFSAVKKNLDKLNINYTLSPNLVRGLDYYNRTIFEISHKDLGAQDALGAGGRYDNLIFELGGPKSGAVGFALGIERLLLVAGCRPHGHAGQTKVFVVTLGEEAKKEGFQLLDKLREADIASDMDYENKSLKGQMRKANDLGVKFTILIGDEELKKQSLLLKDMASGAQEEISFNNFIGEIKKRL
ncbi:MAG: histidine--tRNA ligase [Candidatus Omnitrophota bacterium]|nr:histidine--tRNA ligase [Candidatus Omnitrophota bacterium]